MGTVDVKIINDSKPADNPPPPVPDTGGYGYSTASGSVNINAPSPNKSTVGVQITDVGVIADAKTGQLLASSGGGGGYSGSSGIGYSTAQGNVNISPPISAPPMSVIATPATPALFNLGVPGNNFFTPVPQAQIGYSSPQGPVVISGGALATPGFSGLSSSSVKSDASNIMANVAKQGSDFIGGGKGTVGINILPITTTTDSQGNMIKTDKSTGYFETIAPVKSGSDIALERADYNRLYPNGVKLDSQQIADIKAQALALDDKALGGYKNLQTVVDWKGNVVTQGKDLTWSDMVDRQGSYSHVAQVALNTLSDKNASLADVRGALRNLSSLGYDTVTQSNGAKLSTSTYGSISDRAAGTTQSGALGFSGGSAGVGPLGALGGEVTARSGNPFFSSPLDTTFKIKIDAMGNVIGGDKSIGGVGVGNLTSTAANKIINPEFVESLKPGGANSNKVYTDQGYGKLFSPDTYADTKPKASVQLFPVIGEENTISKTQLPKTQFTVVNPFELKPSEKTVTTTKTLSQTTVSDLGKINVPISDFVTRASKAADIAKITTKPNTSGFVVSLPGLTPTGRTREETETTIKNIGYQIGVNPDTSKVNIYFEDTSKYGKNLYTKLSSPQFDTNGFVGQADGKNYLRINGSVLKEGDLVTTDKNTQKILQDSGAIFNPATKSWHVDSTASNIAAEAIVNSAYLNKEDINSKVKKVGDNYYPLTPDGKILREGWVSLDAKDDTTLATSSGGKIIEPVTEEITQVGTSRLGQVYLPWDKTSVQTYPSPVLPGFLRVGIEDVPVYAGVTKQGVTIIPGKTASEMLSDSQFKLLQSDKDRVYGEYKSKAESIGVPYGFPSELAGGLATSPLAVKGFVGSVLNPQQARLFEAQVRSPDLVSPKELDTSFRGFEAQPAILIGISAATGAVAPILGILGASSSTAATASGLVNRGVLLGFTGLSVAQEGQTPTGFSLGRGLGASAPLVGLFAADVSGVKLGSVSVKTQTELGKLDPLKLDLAKLATNEGGYIGGQTAVELQRPLGSVRSGVDVDIYLKGADKNTLGIEKATEIDQANVAKVAKQALDISKTNYEKIGLDPNTLEIRPAQSHIKIFDTATGKDVADIGIRNQAGDKVVTVDGINARKYNQIFADKNAIIKNVEPTEIKAIKAAKDVAEIKASEDLTVVPDKTIYTGLYRGPSSGSLLKALAGVPGEGAARPVIGLGEKGVIFGTPSDFATTFPSLKNSWFPTQSFASRNVETYPRGSLEMSILGNPKAVEIRGAIPSDIENKFIPISMLSKGLKDETSAFVTNKFPELTKTIDNPTTVKSIVEYANKNAQVSKIEAVLGGSPKISKLSGSFFTQPQIKAELQRVPGDFDITYKSQKEAIQGQKDIMSILKRDGYKPEASTEPGKLAILVNDNVAVDIHALGEKPAGGYTSNANAGMRYGINVNRAPFEMVTAEGKTPVQSLGEQAVRKLTASGTFFNTPGERLVIEPGRAKDVPDAYVVAKTLIDSAKSRGKDVTPFEIELNKFINAKWRTPGVAEKIAELNKIGVDAYLEKNPVKIDITQQAKKAGVETLTNPIIPITASGSTFGNIPTSIGGGGGGARGLLLSQSYTPTSLTTPISIGGGGGGARGGNELSQLYSPIGLTPSPLIGFSSAPKTYASKAPFGPFSSTLEISNSSPIDLPKSSTISEKPLSKEYTFNIQTMENYIPPEVPSASVGVSSPYVGLSIAPSNPSGVSLNNAYSAYDLSVSPSIISQPSSYESPYPSLSKSILSSAPSAPPSSLSASGYSPAPSPSPSPYDMSSYSPPSPYASYYSLAPYASAPYKLGGGLGGPNVPSLMGMSTPAIGLGSKAFPAIRPGYASLLNVMKSEIKYGKATQPNIALHPEQWNLELRSGIQTAEQIAGGDKPGSFPGMKLTMGKAGKDVIRTGKIVGNIKMPKVFKSQTKNLNILGKRR